MACIPAWSSAAQGRFELARHAGDAPIDQWSAASRSESQHQEHRHRRKRVGIGPTIRVTTALGCAPCRHAHETCAPTCRCAMLRTVGSHLSRATAAQAGQVIALRACAHRWKRCTLRARPGMWHRLLSLSFAHCGRTTRDGTPPSARQHVSTSAPSTPPPTTARPAAPGAHNHLAVRNVLTQPAHPCCGRARIGRHSHRGSADASTCRHPRRAHRP
ncbi:hypothetical protein XAC1383 [Xanthomonas citri pv. citri str. 306]|uniref:Uncharacterized protein n=1 Tax=Xanthomonas axonopodis pv. citri (strain 306) TaxID=190486 RepID=A0AAI8ERX8_XANAC|nr:hypothetical protein XAC1383 [Xanthomonas citri pv. citri str. 306]